MSERRKAAFLLTGCILVISLIFYIKEARYNSVQASSFLLDNERKKVVLILADYIQLQDFAENQYLEQLFNNSYSALMSGRQNGKASIIKAKLTIGASKRLEISSGLKSAVNFINSTESTESANNTVKQRQVIYNDIDVLRYQNRESDYSNYIGYLGSKLHQHNKTTCVIGNSDAEIIDRSAVLLVMDEKGIVDSGDVENTTMTDNSFPGGKRTDYNKLIQLYNQHSKERDLIIVDTGDLARLEHYKPQLTSVEYSTARKAAVNNLAEFIEKLISNEAENTAFIILSSYPSKKNIQAGFKLTPFIVHDQSGNGFLYSLSTKRTGIITSLDISNYILEKVTGQAPVSLKQMQGEAPLKSTLTLARRLLNISALRLPVLTSYAIFEIICATAGLIYLLNISSNKLRLIKLIKISMLINLAAPAVLLYMSCFDVDSTKVYFGLFIFLSFLLAVALFQAIKSSLSQFLIAATFVNVSIVIDLFRDSAFIKNSVFGYDPIIGARFYGIGNEFAGVFIGSGILLAGCLLQKYKAFSIKKPKTVTIMLMIYILFQLLMMGMPFTGANFGGTIAGVAGYFFFFCSAKQYRISFKHFIILAIVLAISLSSIVVLDLSNTSSTTHVGMFITDIKENGIKVLYATLIRKAAMNLKLIKYTIWTKVLLCIIVIITIMFFKPVRLLRDIFKEYRYLAASWVGISAASITGLIVNDSGIVMAATGMIFTGYTILYMCLEERTAVK